MSVRRTATSIDKQNRSRPWRKRCVSIRQAGPKYWFTKTLPLAIPEKARLDAEYLARHSIGLDFLILAKTAVLTLSGRGIGH